MLIGDGQASLNRMGDVGLIRQVWVLAKEANELFGHWGCCPEVGEAWSAIPKQYENPDGEIVIVFRGSVLVGFAGYRSTASDECNLDWLYVRQGYRGSGVGRQLVAMAIEEAEVEGFHWMTTTLHRQSIHAQELLDSLGFKLKSEEAELLKCERILVPRLPWETWFTQEIKHRPLSRGVDLA